MNLEGTVGYMSEEMENQQKTMAVLVLGDAGVHLEGTVG